MFTNAAFNGSVHTLKVYYYLVSPSQSGFTRIRNTDRAAGKTIGNGIEKK